MPETKTICLIGGMRINYVIFPGKRIVFSGGDDSTSTTSLAHDIIVAILRKEGIDREIFSFFDFQTHSGFAAIPPGKFDFRKLTILWTPRRREGGSLNPTVDSWERTECPQEVLEIFSIFTRSKNPTQEEPPKLNLKVYRGISIRC